MKNKEKTIILTNKEYKKRQILKTKPKEELILTILAMEKEIKGKELKISYIESEKTVLQFKIDILSILYKSAIEELKKTK